MSKRTSKHTLDEKVTSLLDMAFYLVILNSLPLGG